MRILKTEVVWRQDEGCSEEQRGRDMNTPGEVNGEKVFSLSLVVQDHRRLVPGVQE